MQPPSNSTPKVSELDPKTFFEDAELVTTNPTAPKPPDAYSMSHFPPPSSCESRIPSTPAVYYRIYTEDGAIPSRSPVYTDDPYLARIWAKQVALPRTLASLKRCLSAVECLGSAHNDITLFASAKSEGPMEDTGCGAGVVSLTHDTGTSGDPMIVLVKAVSREHERLDISKPEAVLLPPREGATPFKAEFCMHAQIYPLTSAELWLFTVYYRIYTEDGAIPSKHPINSSDLSLGRINIDIITPPHTINSIKWCIAKAEQLGFGGTDSKLFRNMGSETPMDTGKVSVLGGGDRLGLGEEDPMVYVHRSPMYDFF